MPFCCQLIKLLTKWKQKCYRLYGLLKWDIKTFIIWVALMIGRMIKYQHNDQQKFSTFLILSIS